MIYLYCTSTPIVDLEMLEKLKTNKCFKIVSVRIFSGISTHI